MEGGGPLIEGGGPLIEGGGPLIEGGGIAGAVVAIPIGAPVPPDARGLRSEDRGAGKKRRRDGTGDFLHVAPSRSVPVLGQRPARANPLAGDEQGDSGSGKSFTRQGEEKSAARLGGQIKKDCC